MHTRITFVLRHTTERIIDVIGKGVGLDYQWRQSGERNNYSNCYLSNYTDD